MAKRPTALTIAGSDSGGGAGLQADLKTFERFGAYGTCAVTLVTAQNTLGVQSIQMLHPALLRSQIDAVANDIGANATKTGAIGSRSLIETTAEAIEAHDLHPLVVDPVMISQHGHALLPAEAAEALRQTLIPMADLITPNVHEAAALTGMEVTTEAQMEEAARALLQMGPGAVVVTGGASSEGRAVDVLLFGEERVVLSSPRIDTPHTHGTGCTFSAAITALMAQGAEVAEAVTEAKAWIDVAIRTAPGLGAGHGPINHLAPRPRVSSLAQGVQDVYVNVADMERALAFYTGVLGLEVTEADAHWASLDCGGTRVGLHWTGGGAVPALPYDDHGAQAGATLTLRVDDAARAVSALHAAGADVVGEMSAPWGDMIVCLDPDGNVFKLMRPAD